MTPTQLSLVQELLAMLSPSNKSKPKPEGSGFGVVAGGQPMRSEHYAHVSDTVAAQVVGGVDLDRLMMGGRDTMSAPHSNAISGGAQTAFYELQRGKNMLKFYLTSVFRYSTAQISQRRSHKSEVYDDFAPGRSGRPSSSETRKWIIGVVRRRRKSSQCGQ
jgi:hypothetical protein